MQRLQRYILRQLAGPFVFFLLALTGIIWLSQSLRFVDLIVNRGLSAGYFLHLTLLVLPGVLTIILPIALFGAILYTYQRLNAESEVVVMRSAGLSDLAIARPAIVLAIFVTTLSFGLTLGLMPAGQRAFSDMKTTLRTDLSYVLLQEGRFNILGDTLTVYIRARTSNGELRGILVHDSRDEKHPVTMMAESGAFVQSTAGPRFVLLNGNRQQVDREDGSLSLLQFDSYTLDLGQFVKPEAGRWLKPGERYLHELLNPDGTPDDIANANALWAEAHDRLTSPFYALAFTLIALAFMLSGQINRRRRSSRIIGAVVAIILVRAIGLGLVTATAKLPMVTPLIYLNIIAVSALAIYVLLRVPRGGAAHDTVAEGAA